jgi:MFS family permease
MWAGKAAAGAVIPFIMEVLLYKYGAGKTLRAWAVALVVLTAPLLFYLKPRIPISPAHTRRPLCWTFLKKPGFWLLQIGNIIQALGYLLPATYLASYAKDVGIQSPIKGAMLIAVVSLANVPGSMFSGFLGDHYPAATVILISSIGSSMAVLLLWGLAAQMALLVPFAALYGFFGGGFSSSYSAIAKEMKRADEGVEDGVVMGCLLGARGVGFMVGGPMSAALLNGRSNLKSSGFDGKYGLIIVFTGATALFGSCGLMWTTLKAVCGSSVVRSSVVCTEAPVICMGNTPIRRPIHYNAL